MKLKRDFPGMFDVAKGILILLIILLHQKMLFHVDLQISHPLLSLRWGDDYDAVLVGLFFMMAGYGSRAEKDLRGYVKRSVKGNLIPYFWTMIGVMALMVVRCLYRGEVGPQDFSSVLLGFLYGNGVPGAKLFGVWEMRSVGAAWFLPALFWSGLIHQLLLRIKRPAVRETLIFGVSLAAVACPGAHVPWRLLPGCAAVGFREAGRLLKGKKVLYQKVNWPLAAAAIALTLVAPQFTTVKFGSNHWRLWVLDYVPAVAACGVVLQFYIKSGLAVAKFADALAYVGRYSLLFLCIHSVELTMLPWNKLYARILAPLGLPWGAAFLVMYAVRVLGDALGCQMIVWISGRMKKARRSQI